MSKSAVRLHAWLFVAAGTVAVACSPAAPPAINVSQEDVVLAYVDEGMNADVADCLIGLASREFELDLLLPGAAPDGAELLLDEMQRSCADAVAALSEEDLVARRNFESGPFNVGDDMYLDQLFAGCTKGDGADCDELWEESPVGSIYESFGVTCGNRPAILDCTEEMNGPDQTPETAN